MPTHLTRRKVLQTLGLGAIGASSFSMGCKEVANQSSNQTVPVLRFVHLTDMHLQPGGIAEEGVKKCIDHVLKNEGSIDFFINGGDLIMDALNKPEEDVAAQWEVWRKVQGSYPELKFYHCIGNHDVWGLTPNEEKFRGKEWVMNEHGLESPYYHFESNGWHFIVLDSTHTKEDGTWYTAKLDVQQREWLEKKLREITMEAPILIVSHIPILGATPFLDGDNAKTGNWIVPGAWMHTDAKSLINLFYNHKNIKVCISGHIHLVETLVYHDVHYHCSGAVCGNWWGDEPYELTNKGYALIELYKDGSHTYKYVEYLKEV
jgi:3',5'-cyclic-AMP phosphodiesterase